MWQLQHKADTSHQMRMIKARTYLHMVLQCSTLQMFQIEAFHRIWGLTKLNFCPDPAKLSKTAKPEKVIYMNIVIQ